MIHIPQIWRRDFGMTKSKEIVYSIVHIKTEKANFSKSINLTKNIQ